MPINPQRSTCTRARKAPVSRMPAWRVGSGPHHWGEGEFIQHLCKHTHTAHSGVHTPSVRGRGAQSHGRSRHPSATHQATRWSPPHAAPHQVRKGGVTQTSGTWLCEEGAGTALLSAHTGATPPPSPTSEGTSHVPHCGPAQDSGSGCSLQQPGLPGAWPGLGVCRTSSHTCAGSSLHVWGGRAWCPMCWSQTWGPGTGAHPTRGVSSRPLPSPRSCPCAGPAPSVTCSPAPAPWTRPCSRRTCP